MPETGAAAQLAEVDEFGAWLVVREITDEPTLARAVHLLHSRGDRYRRGPVFALTDPAAPPEESLAAVATFAPVDADTLELSAVAVADGYAGLGLTRRLLEPVSHMLAARGVSRIVTATGDDLDL